MKEIKIQGIVSRQINKISKSTKVALVFILFLLFVIFIMTMFFKTTRVKRVDEKIPSKQEETSGMFTEKTNNEGYAKRTEKREHAIEEKLKKQKSEIDTLKEQVKNVVETNKVINKRLTFIDKSITKAVDKGMGEISERLKGIMPPVGAEAEGIPSFTPAGITKYHSGGKKVEGDIPEESPNRKKEKRKYVYLPMGSFVKGTLLTGVYAPGEKENPLPVLISIDEAFYGPSMSRIPLKGCLAIGKAVGDINARRAIVQIVGISYVFPNGEAFEKEGNIGYLTGKDGTLGVPGKLVRRTGKELGGSFASGFLSGFADALGEGETSTSVGALTGEATKVITGSALKYGGYSGLAAAAGKMSEYYAKQLEQITTAVQVDMGQKVYLIMQKGVEIEGLIPKQVSVGHSGLD